MQHASATHTIAVTLPQGAFQITLTPAGVSALAFGAATGNLPAPRSGLEESVAIQLGEYLEGHRRRFEVPVDLSACPAFQRRVLEACAAIDYAVVTTYAELARRVGHPGAARAVGTALARNPVPILVPCHRVLRRDGGLGGYLAGLEWKQRLLRLEGVSLI